MSCSSCGGRKPAPVKPGSMRPSAMKTGSTHFQFGPYGSRVSKTILGRVPASKLRIKKTKP